VNYDHNKWEAKYKDFRNNKVEVLRQWIHCDGNRTIRLFNETTKDPKKKGYFLPLPKQYLDDAIDNIRLAKQYNIKLLLTFWSYQCVGVEDCRNLILDQDRQDSFFQNGV